MKRTSFTMMAALAAIFVLADRAEAYLYCSRPSEPYIPSGYYAESYQMETARREVEDYVEAMNRYIRCLIDEVEEAERDAGQTIDEWNSAVNTYNYR